MNSYISDTKYAASSLINSIVKSRNEFNKLCKTHRTFKIKEKECFEYLKKTGSYEDLFELVEWKNAAEKKQKEIIDYKSFLINIDFSLSVLAGGLLQIAKQGISFCYQGLTNCPNGRIVGNEFLKNIIWQSRNQTMHYEEGNYNQNVINCFQNLENAFGSQFSIMNNTHTNMAYKIILLLRWDIENQYIDDMVSLLG